MEYDAWELLDPAFAPRDGNLAPYLRRVLERCACWFDACGVSIFLREPGGAYVLAAQYGTLPPIPIDARIRIGQGVAGAALQQARPLRVVDPQTEPSLAGRVGAVRREIGSAMVVPLVVPGGDALGVLNVARAAGQAELAEEDLRRAVAIGHQVALAVGTATLLVESRQSRDRFEALVEAVPSAVFEIDPEGGAVPRNLQARALAAESPKWLGDVLRPHANLRRVHNPESDRTWIVTRTAYGEAQVVTIDEITESEREARETARTRRLAEIGQMTAAIAHDIRNPLTGIRSAAQMIAIAPEEAREFATIIEEEVLKLDSLCNQFLEFARPLALRFEPRSIVELAQKVAERETGAFSEADVDLVCELDADAPTIFLDAVRIESVLHNLLRNALQASAPGGRVTVRAAGHALEVEDEGIGMTPEFLTRLFTPFLTTKPKGTGLGLTNVRKIVEAHGGTVEVRSEVGRGSVFTVRFVAEAPDALGRVA